jgi:hypothetical protein
MNLKKSLSELRYKFILYTFFLAYSSFAIASVLVHALVGEGSSAMLELATLFFCMSMPRGVASSCLHYLPSRYQAFHHFARVPFPRAPKITPQSWTSVN